MGRNKEGRGNRHHTLSFSPSSPRKRLFSEDTVPATTVCQQRTRDAAAAPLLPVTGNSVVWLRPLFLPPEKEFSTAPASSSVYLSIQDLRLTLLIGKRILASMPMLRLQGQIKGRGEIFSFHKGKLGLLTIQI